ncbi:MAG: hypothetical protein ACRCVJ_11865 [Clostridium sp.]|uniref:hypothetical protein n=1 Tax=Clostridium sp. TaxID=1506 RepID=UPI003F2C9781
MEHNDIVEYIKGLDNSFTVSGLAQIIQEFIEELNDIDIIETHEDIPIIIRGAIAQYCDCNKDEIIECANEFIAEFNNDHNKYIEEFKELLDEYCDQNSLCKICFKELENSSHYEDRGEYFGISCSEKMTEYFCPSGCFGI